MFILLYIFLGLLLFDFLIAYRIYFLKKNRSKQYEEQLKKLKTVKSTKHSKAA